jgi:hypothetical protein
MTRNFVIFETTSKGDLEKCLCGQSFFKIIIFGGISIFLKKCFDNKRGRKVLCNNNE